MGNAYTLANMFKSYTVIIFCNKVDGALLSEWMKGDINVHMIPDEQMGGPRSIRLATGRNRLLQAVRDHMAERNESAASTYMAVMDMDDVNDHRFNSTVLEQVMSLDEQWDAVSFTRPFYYDIWALRYDQFNVNYLGVSNPWHFAKIMQQDIKSRLLADPEKPFFPVYSAFNGFALYKMEVVGNCLYDGVDSDAITSVDKGGKPRDDFVWGDCEHVAFHKCIRQSHDARIMIYKHSLHTRIKWPSSVKNPKDAIRRQLLLRPQRKS